MLSGHDDLSAQSQQLRAANRRCHFPSLNLISRILTERLLAREAQSPAANIRAAEKEQEPGLDKAYIRGQLLEVMPLVKECYENALQSNPRLEGRLIVHFSIVAEPRIGGLVDSSEVEREGPLGQEPALVECVQESIYALKLKAPQGGGQVRYPARGHQQRRL